MRTIATLEKILSAGLKIFLLLLSANFFAPAVSAQAPCSPPSPYIIIDGNPCDWPNAFTNPAVTVKQSLLDPQNSSADDIWTGGSSDVSPIANWAWKSGSSNDKNDMKNVGVALVGSKLYFFADRFANNGDAQLGIWLLKGSIAKTGTTSGGFSGSHQDGDILLRSHFVNGGSVADRAVYVWSGGPNGAPVLTNLSVNDLNFASNATSVPVPSPFVYSPKSGTANTYPKNSFVEGFLDLAALAAATGTTLDLCFASFLIETGNSQSISSSLEDLVLGRFGAVPNPQNLTGSSACTGTGTLTMAGSEPGISYQLMLGATPVQASQPGTGNQIIWTGLASGNYTVLATNVLTNCTNTYGPAEVIANTAPNCSISGPTTVCAASAHVYTSEITPAGGTVTHSWTISGCGTITGSSTGASVTVSAHATSASCTYTLTDNVTRNGCTTSCTREVTVNPDASADAGTEPAAQCRLFAPVIQIIPPVCPGYGTNIFSVNGSGSNGTPLWSVLENNTGFTVNIESPSSYNTNVQISGTDKNEGYVRLRLTVTNNSGCSNATDEVILRLKPTPACRLLEPTPFCSLYPASGSVRLRNSENGVNYQLKKDNVSIGAPLAGNGADLLWSNLAAGNYTAEGRYNQDPDCSMITPQATVQEIPVPEPLAQNKDVCIGTCVILTGTPSGGTWSGAYVSGNRFCAPTSLSAGTYTVTYTVTDPQTGCSGSDEADIRVMVCVTDYHCTYTQGYYGNANGSSCDGTTTYPTTTALLSALLDIGGIGNPVTIGRSGQSLTVPATEAGRDKLIEILPAGFTPRALKAGDCDITTSCLTDAPTYLKIGKLNNVLAGQTLALSLNMRLNGGSLGIFPIQSGWITTQKRDGCGSGATPVNCSAGNNAIESFQMNDNVAAYLNSAGSPYFANVTGLLDLANDALGGTITPGSGGIPTFAQINNAVDVINNAFDKCRIILGYNPCQVTCDALYPSCSISGPSSVVEGSSLVSYSSDATPGVTHSWTVSGNATISGSSTGSSVTVNAGAFAGGNFILTDNITTTCLNNTTSCSKTVTVTQAFARSSGGSALTEINPADKLEVSVFPNPFKNAVKFTVASPVSGQARLDILNMFGQRIQTVFNGIVLAGVNQVFEYKAPVTGMNTLIYVLSIGDYQATGKLINIK